MGPILGSPHVPVKIEQESGSTVLNLHRMRLLREIHLRGTLAAAAAALGYDPSSVSHQITALQREVGAPLLEPAGRTVRLTAAALVLVEHTEQILRHLEEAEADVASVQGGAVRGTVRIATFQTAAHTLLPRAARALAETHPDLALRVTHLDAGRALPALVARDVDLVLLEGYPGHEHALLPGIECAPLARDPLWLLTPAGERPVPLARTADRPWVLEASGTPARRWATATCRAAGFEPEPVYESADLLLHVRLVTDAGAVAIVPGLALSATDTSGVRATPLDDAPARTISTAVRRGSARSPSTGAVRAALIQSVPRHGL